MATPDEQQPTLTERMRSATISEHDKSNTLVNLKLALVLTSPALYGEALSLFLPVFDKIESILEGHSSHPQVGKLAPILGNLRRTPGFRSDVSYYVTTDRREELEVAQASGEQSELGAYLAHLDKISDDDPILLIAYVYHLYAGVLAGGQLIKAMVRKAMGLSKESNDGVMAFSMKDGVDPKEFMTTIKTILNEDIVVTEEEATKLVCEGAVVFRLNDELVGTVRGTKAWGNAADECVKRVLLPLVGIGLFIAAYSAWLTFVKYEFVHANEFDKEA